MDITEVKVNIVPEGDDRLLGFCSVTFDDQFVVRDLRIIRRDEQLFVAMPSRKVTCSCYRCRGRNAVDASFCNHCGCAEPVGEMRQSASPHPFVDIAHPINRKFRKHLERHVLHEYRRQASGTLSGPDRQPDGAANDLY